MGNILQSANCCNCNKKSNQEDISDLLSITSNEARVNIIQIQSLVRGFLSRKRARFFLDYFSSKHGRNKPFDLSKMNGKQLDIHYEPELNEKVILMKDKLPPFELNEKEMYLLRSSSLKKFVIEYPDMTVYKGYLNSNWQKEGYGQLFMNDGSVYEGGFKSNMMEGRGRVINIQGYSYEGEFSKNKADGFGKYTSLDGVVYSGGWLDEKQHGYGEESYPDGSTFQGEYFMGKKNGHGKFKSSDGHIYDGEFLNNEIQGYGVYRWSDGRIFQGQWLNNKMNGTGIFIWPDKKKYVGSYLNDNKHGYGIFYWPDGRKYEGSWENGKQHGYGILYDRNGLSHYGEWKTGKKIKLVTNEEQEIAAKEIQKKMVDSNFSNIEKMIQNSKNSFRSYRSVTSQGGK